MGKPASVSAVVTDHVGKIGENLVLRRVGRINVPGGIVAPYIHNSIAPGLGSIGVVVGLRAVPAPAPAPKKDDKKGGAATAAATAAAADASTAAKAPYDLSTAPAEVKTAVADIAKKLAMHVAAAKPAYLTRAHVPSEAVERERNVLLAQAASANKPADIVARMVEGKLGKFYGETVLLEQPYVASEEGAKVSKVLADAAKKIAGLPAGYTLEVAGFYRLVLGEAAAALEAAQQQQAAAGSA